MNDQNNKLFWVIIVLVALLLLVGFGGKFFIDKVSDRVIQKLQKEYSPSPYGPGFDPDKIDSEKLRTPPPPGPPQKTGGAGWEDWQK